jgi:hypothetical protein
MGKLKDATQMDDIKKLEALKNTRDHWQWLADNPWFDKGCYPLFENYSVSHDCYLCEYTEYSADNEEACVNCPLRGYAWDDRCWFNETPYDKWMKTKDKTLKSIYAIQMVDACNQAIDDLNFSYCEGKNG